MPQSAPPFTTIRRQFSFVTLGANLVGALLTFLYLALIDPLPIAVETAEDLQGSSIIFVVLLLVLFSIGILWNGRVTARIGRWYDQLQQGHSSSDVPAEISRDVLHFVLRSTLTSAALWTAAGMYYAFDSTDPLRTLIGIVGVGGVLTTAIIYFVTDVIWRQAIPVFFPSGQLSRIRALRLPVLGRLLIVFLLIGVWPTALLANLSLQRARALVSAPNPQAIFDNLVVVVLFVLIVSVLASLTMALFVTRSIVGPLRTLQTAMARVEQNEFDVQVPVTSNDELGYLGEGFNRMTAGLRQGELLRNLFNLYVSPEVAREVVAHGARLGGKQVECTVLFSDIRDFTGLSERLSPAALIELLNRYMTAMVAVVVAHDGIVNKFGGDSLLAVFGTPLNPARDHAAQAVRAALEMGDALVEFNQGQMAVEGPTLRIGIGIATGPVVAGNIGGSSRIEYTVIGDTVNLASRLQTLTKELQSDILVSEQTYLATAETTQIDAALLPAVSVRGKREAVNVYALQRHRSPQHADRPSNT